jgi:RHS repeat-associated protein
MNSLRGIAGRTLNYSDEDHLLTAGTTTYQYNVDGFLSAKTDGSDVTTYDHSSRGELLSVMLPDGRAIEYVHDPLGRRIAKKIDGVIVEKYLWQGLTRLLAVYDGSNSLLLRFGYTDRRMPLVMTKGGSTYYLTYDQVGSLRVVADASGNMVKRIDYDSFGNIISDSDPSFEVPFGFDGGLHDQDTGLVRFGYRDYDPDTGRWTAKDPIFFTGGDTDLYGYCLNNPINFIDPTGQFGIAGFAVGIAAGAYGGFVGGMASGNVATGIISGIVGGVAGGIVGIVAPQLSTIAGGIAGGIVGGIAGSVTGVYLDNPCGATFSNYANSAVFGGFAGGLTGAMGGAFTAGAQMLGASGVAVDIASAMTTAPVGIGLGMGVSAIPN